MNDRKEIGSTGEVMSFVVCDLESMPRAVQTQFDKWSHSQRLDSLRGSMFRLDLADQGNVFVAGYTGKTDTDLDFSEVYTADVNNEGSLMGRGIIALIQGDEDLSELPFVRYTRTEDEYQQQGLGLRRLVVMNEVTKRIFDQTLSSSTLIEPAAERLWQQLELQGLATRHQERYRFIK